jgi:hypothetical protein
MALTDDQDAVAVLKACGVELFQLRQNLIIFINNEFN